MVAIPVGQKVGVLVELSPGVPCVWAVTVQAAGKENGPDNREPHARVRWGERGNGTLWSAIVRRGLTFSTKSVHMTLVHSRSGLCLLLCDDFLDGYGDRRRIVEV